VWAARTNGARRSQLVRGARCALSRRCLRGLHRNRSSGRTSCHSARAGLLLLRWAAVALFDNKGWSPYGAPWLQPVAISRKSTERRSGRKQAKTVAVGCDQLPRRAHGKEGVDGSSPSEGFRKRPAYRGSLLSVTTLASSWRTHFRHQLVARVADNGLCRAPFGTRKLLDHMRVRRKHHGRGMSSLLRDLDNA
jgi:hypothetical protein